ncbi:MAG: protein phosphatase 2C domain-containing protein [Oscillospiraceae bacterium]|nr:protein phosphatase 2C domain-containing protein [Oscillospiraceae bacterium]
MVNTLKLWGLTDKGAVRDDNQDAYFADMIPASDGEYALIAVCDGMGGARGGGIASSLAAEIFVQAVKDRIGGNAQDLLTYAIIETRAAIDEYSNTHADCAGMGTTLVAALIAPDGNVTIANVGDSRCYLIRRAKGNADETTNASIRQITKDHSLVEEMVERGELKREDARFHPRRNLITRVLSAEADSTPDFFKLLLEDGDVLLLCSDGLSNTLDAREVLFEIQFGKLDTAAKRCLNIALERGAPDNVTIVIAAFEPDNKTVKEAESKD